MSNNHTVTSSIVVNLHPSIHTKFYGFNQMLCDKCTWPWGHCLLFDLGGAPTPRLADIMDTKRITALDRGNLRGEPWMESAKESLGPRLEWKGRRDDERRWLWRIGVI
ncbi:hypothetical protein TNCV_4367781 [Trichonephila clavipes]|nr:hypothetical protein TNCV_4367781 [Trichonephila clavipes]